MTSIPIIKAPLSVNERKLLNIIRQNGVMPRHKIVTGMDITVQAIGQITKRLDHYKLLIHHKAVKVGLGQPPKPISINPDNVFSIGIKVGRRHTELMLVDLVGAVRERHSITYAFPVTQDLLPQIGRHLGRIQLELEQQDKQLIGIGVAAPFALGGWHKLLGLSDAQADEWNSLNLVAAIQDMTPRPVKLVKDTAAACIAEMLNGQGKICNNFLYIFVDTFVGGSVVANAQWFATTNGNSGAVASLPMRGAIPKDQLLNNASLWELEQLFRSEGLEPSAAYDNRALAASHATLTAKWLDTASRSLAFAIVSGAAFLDTDAVVLDGSMAPDLLSQLICRTENALADFNWQGIWQPKLLKGLIGSDAGALGGALLPLHEYFYA